jgi:hypothetical protein
MKSYISVYHRVYRFPIASRWPVDVANKKKSKKNPHHRYDIIDSNNTFSETEILVWKYTPSTYFRWSWVSGKTGGKVGSEEHGNEKFLKSFSFFCKIFYSSIYFKSTNFGFEFPFLQK